MKNQLQVLGAWVSLSLLAACGKTSDIAWVRLDLGIPTEQGRKSVNLMDDFAALSQFEKAYLKKASCKQQNLVAAVQLEGDAPQLFSYPIEISTAMGSAPGTGAAVTALFSNAVLEKPIEFGVPKGAKFKFGVMGFFVDPSDANSDGICDRTTNNNPPSGGNESATYSAFGDSEAIVDGSVVLALNVWAINAQQTPPANTCINSAIGQIECPSRSFIKLQNPNPYPISNWRVEYLFANNRPFRVVQTFKAIAADAAGDYVAIPRMFPIEVVYKPTGAANETRQRIESSSNLGTPTITDAFRAYSF